MPQEVSRGSNKVYLGTVVAWLLAIFPLSNAGLKHAQIETHK